MTDNTLQRIRIFLFLLESAGCCGRLHCQKASGLLDISLVLLVMLKDLKQNYLQTELLYIKPSSVELPFYNGESRELAPLVPDPSNRWF